MHIAIAGNIGSGKTTLTTKLAKHYKWEAHYEDVENNPYLNDVKVRKALAYTIDRKAIVEKVTKCGQLPAYSFTPPGSNGYYPDTEIPFDPKLAKQLMLEAGYSDSNPFPKLEILFNTNEDHRKIALAIQQMWQQNLGIEVELVNQDWKVYLSREMVGDFQVSRAGWIGDYEDPNTFLDLMRPNRGNNKTGWEDPEFDAIVQKANSTNNQEERYKLKEFLLIICQSFLFIHTLGHISYLLMLKATILIFLITIIQNLFL